LDAVVLDLVVVIAGGGAGLLVGMKSWRRTSWSSSASGRRRRLGGEARWRPDEAMRRTTHPVMGVVRPLVAAGQSSRPSSSALPVSIVVGITGIVASLRRRVVASSRRRVVASSHRRIVASSSSLWLVLITFTAAIALASAIAAAIIVAANAATAALR